MRFFPMLVLSLLLAGCGGGGGGSTAGGSSAGGGVASTSGPAATGQTTTTPNVNPTPAVAGSPVAGATPVPGAGPAPGASPANGTNPAPGAAPVPGASPVPGGSPGQGGPTQGGAAQPNPAPLTGVTVETYQFSQIAIGPQANNESGASLTMGSPIRLPDGTYRMYYNWDAPELHQIKYAESSDLKTWTVKGVSLSGPVDPNDPENVTGGASVIRLSDGTYRMYYRSSPKQTPGVPPLFTIRSAVSPDGTTFTRESGVRINIVAFDASSPLQLAGHGSFYRLANGTYAGIFSANFVGDTSASDLTLATSNDGLTWGNFKLLYDGVHDPVVLQRDGKYVLYANYLGEGMFRAVSDDGVTWPEKMDTVELYNANGERHLEGDVGALLTPEGITGLITNFSTGPVSLDLAYFLPKP